MSYDCVLCVIQKFDHIHIIVISQSCGAALRVVFIGPVSYWRKFSSALVSCNYYIIGIGHMRMRYEIKVINVGGFNIDDLEPDLNLIPRQILLLFVQYN